MFTLKTSLATGAALLIGACATSPTATPQHGLLNIGRAATAQELRGWDIDVDADGVGLPTGSGSVAQGRQLYAAKCQACHGVDGKGGIAPQLAGGRGTLGTDKPVRTIGSFWPYAPPIFDYINRSMPWDSPMSLTSNDVYAVTAYLLHANGIVPADAVMDARALASVRMPNRNGFVDEPPGARISGTRCMSNCIAK